VWTRCPEGGIPSLDEIAAGGRAGKRSCELATGCVSVQSDSQQTAFEASDFGVPAPGCGGAP